MRPHTALLAAAALVLGTTLGTVGFAADPQQSRALPKEGTWKGQYTSYGMQTASIIGNERVLLPLMSTASPKSQYLGSYARRPAPRRETYIVRPK